MAGSGFSLREKDKKRLIKDRLAKAMVTCGGLAVLAALILIFVYLVNMVIPLFSSPQIKPYASSQLNTSSQPLAMGIDDSGQSIYTLTSQNGFQFYSLNRNKLTGSSSFKVPEGIQYVARTIGPEGWLVLVDSNDNVTPVKPTFTHAYRQNRSHVHPDVSYFYREKTISLKKESARLTSLAFSINQGVMTIAAHYSDGSVDVRWYNQEKQLHHYTLQSQFPNVDQLVMTPDGKTLYIRSGSKLSIAEKTEHQFRVRQEVDLARGEKSAVHSIKLLAGAYSLLVTYDNGTISQWFDVLRNEKRSLTFIRSFKSSKDLNFILPDAYRKGFYAFFNDGVIKSYYTTSDRVLTFNHIYDSSPQLAAMSANEEYLLAYDSGKVLISAVNTYAPEISFSSLWRKVWYESYPKPEYVWQTTSASHDYEAKYSLIPLTFGTLKAAMFAMLFSLPIAICGAIYTAYFMSESMRRIVKPSIELMEALPTVIIGFLAGLWFAPIVESHLVSIVLAMLLLPPFIVFVGLCWKLLPVSVTNRCPNGWHPLILMPLIAIFTYFVLGNSGIVENWLFDGDVRVFLANHGIDYNQRNALVVGFAMGFAVIPTIFTIAEDAVFSVPKHLSDGSLALGATPWQTLINVVLQTASPGIFSAVMMGLGRAVGETMIVLMATGNTPIMDWNILEGMRTLSATIAIEMPESEVGSPHFRLLFLSALILLVFTFAVNSLAEWVRQRLREKYRAM